MKKINGSILKARMDDKQLLVNQACFLENLETTGKGANTLLGEAREFLGVDSEDSIVANHTDKIKEFNKLSNAVVGFNRALVSLKELNLLEADELSTMENAHNKLLEKLCNIYDTNTDELLSEE